MKKLCDSIMVQGSVSLSGIHYGNSRWKMGAISVVNDNGTWKVLVNYDCTQSKAPTIAMQLNSVTIKRTICKMQFVLEMRDGTNIRMKSPNLGEMQALDTLINRIKNDQMSPGGCDKAEVSINKSLSKTPSKSPAPLENDVSPAYRNRNESHSPQFTSVKSHLKLDEDFKENHPCAQSTVFISRNDENGRETLQSIGAPSFYNKTPAATNRLFGNKTTHSSIKRLPGLMPDPSPVAKRPRLLSDSISVNYSWQKNKSSPIAAAKPQALQGFSNLGNTCYMNAILQSLFALDTFSTDLLYNNRLLLKTLSNQSLYFTLAKLLNARRKNNISDVVRRDLLRGVKMAISSNAKRFSGNQQHDAHEFLGQVLDQLKEEVLKFDNSSSGQTQDDDVSVSEVEHVNPTIQNFEFEVLHSIRCTACGELVTKSEQFHDLSLDVPKRRDIFNPRTLQDAVDIYFKPEQIEYTCSMCDGTKAEVKHTFSRLPRVLILHLKRYCFSVTAAKQAKMIQNILIPRYLTLHQHCENETVPPLPSCTRLDDSVLNSGAPRRRLDYTPTSYKFKKLHLDESRESSSNKMSLISEIESSEASIIKDSQRRKSDTEELPLIKAEGDDLELVQSGDGELELMPSGDGELELLNSGAEELELVKALEISLQETKDNKQKCAEEVEDFEKILEVSRQENEKPPPDTDGEFVTDTQLKDLSEEDQINLAIQMSLRNSPTMEAANLCTSSDNNAAKFHGIRHQNVATDDTLPDIAEIPEGQIVDFNSDENSSAAEHNSLHDEHVYHINHDEEESEETEVFLKEDCELSKHSSSATIQSEVDIFGDVQSNISHSGATYGSLTCIKKDTREDLQSSVFQSASRLGNLSSVSDTVHAEPNEMSGDAPGKDTRSKSSLLGGSNDKLSLSKFGRLKEDLTCPENMASFEDKENVLPPDGAVASNFPSIQPLTESNSPADGATTLPPTYFDEESRQKKFEEDLRKATELSLQDQDGVDNFVCDEDDSIQETPFERTKDESELLKKNFEKGQLPNSYRLMSVVSHIGSSSVVGHYLCDVYDIKKSCWYSYDDTHVNKTTEAEMKSKREKSGYIFFYLDKGLFDDLKTHNAISLTEKQENS